MAKRYGRNQRRRAREQIAVLNQKIHDLRMELAMTKGKLRGVSVQKEVLTKLIAEFGQGIDPRLEAQMMYDAMRRSSPVFDDRTTPPI